MKWNHLHAYIQFMASEIQMIKVENDNSLIFCLLIASYVVLLAKLDIL